MEQAAAAEQALAKSDTAATAFCAVRTVLECIAIPLAEHRDALAAEVARLREALAASEARATKAEGVIAEALAVTEGMCGQPRATLAFALAGVRMALTSAAKGAGR